MLAIVGILVVFGAIIGGYLLEHGNLIVLFQPAELVIIGGSALGTMLIANPLPLVIKILKGLTGVLAGSPYSKPFYLETLKMLSDFFNKARRDGLAGIEADIEDPKKSQVFSKYPKFLKNHHAVAFFCDTLRMASSGGVGHFELDQMMELDIDTHHRDSAAPIAALSTVADSLPGLGIVAAVLGVVITMGALGGPPEEIGHKVAAALVGTFLGILLCYGFVGPLASNLAKIADAESQYYQCLRMAILAQVRGESPLIAVEFARRSIPGDVRPSFTEMEAACKKSAVAGQPPQAA